VKAIHSAASSADISSSSRPRLLAAREFATLRDLRQVFARGGLRSERTPHHDVRLASFRVVVELLRLLEEFRRRIEEGERCRIVEREHARRPGQFVLEFMIEGATVTSEERAP
jgi:hypothetical protein